MFATLLRQSGAVSARHLVKLQAPASVQSLRSASTITMKDGVLNVPNDPIIPFIEGDGTGPDIWRSTQRVVDAAGRFLLRCGWSPCFSRSLPPRVFVALFFLEYGSRWYSAKCFHILSCVFLCFCVFPCDVCILVRLLVSLTVLVRFLSLSPSLSLSLALLRSGESVRWQQED
jgi:hypothetical protein